MKLFFDITQGQMGEGDMRKEDGKDSFYMTLSAAAATSAAVRPDQTRRPFFFFFSYRLYELTENEIAV